MIVDDEWVNERTDERDWISKASFHVGLENEKSPLSFYFVSRMNKRMNRTEFIGPFSSLVQRKWSEPLKII